MASSVSTKGMASRCATSRPMDVLPVPERPTRTTCGRSASAIAQGVDVRAMVAPQPGDRAPPDLAHALVCEHAPRHRLCPAPHARNRRDVGALLEADRLLLRPDVDGLQHRTV